MLFIAVVPHVFHPHPGPKIDLFPIFQHYFYRQRNKIFFQTDRHLLLLLLFLEIKLAYLEKESNESIFSSILPRRKKNSSFRLDRITLGQDVGRKAKRPTDIISDPLDCTGLQHLGLEQGASQGWGGLPRCSLPPHCLPPPPGHHSHTHPPAAGASAFNPFHHSIEQRSPRLPGPNSGENCIRHSYAKHPTYHPRRINILFFSSK